MKAQKKALAAHVWRSAAPRPAPEPARIPALPEPLVTPEWHGAPWPLNEEEIDLPTPAAPAAPEPGPSVPEAMRWIGYVRAGCVGVRGQFDMDVLVLPAPDARIVFGQAQLDREQALRLCHLLLRAVGALQAPAAGGMPCAA